MEIFIKSKYGNSYLASTNPDVIDAIDSVMNKDIRIRFWYGDNNTGDSWVEENDTMGTVGRSTGDSKIPLLIKNIKSTGGSPILTHCIVKIVDITYKKVLYVHPKFTLPAIEVFQNYVMVDNKIHANCKSFEEATKLAKFLKGDRNSK